VSLLGEISKNSEALRYHAKTAEVAGQNLAHVNDETYARQRVIAREGVMHKAFGGLLTSGLEAAGVEHARNELLDRRVINEVGEGKSLAAQKEILELLQVALGEEITRQGVNVGLDDLHESDLAPGSLTRALNDFFNTFEELSASPYEPAIKQELFHKIQTLTKRFNEAGQSLEQIESELTGTIERSVEEANRILEQIHAANIQVRRFELLDQGRAVSYRDERQALLERLAGYVNFTTKEEVNEVNNPTGFLSLYVPGEHGTPPSSHAILDNNGVVGFTNNWGQEVALAAPVDALGSTAKVRAKIGSDGKLGRFEILDGGSRYNDSDGPFLFTLLPPKTQGSSGDQAAADDQQEQAPQQDAGADGLQADPTLQAGQGVDTQITNDTADTFPADTQEAVTADPLKSEEARTVGEVFHQGGKYYQALTTTIKDDLLADEGKFMVIQEPLPNGIFAETKRSFSDLEYITKGSQVYYEGSLYQATADIGPTSVEAGVANAETDTVATSRGYEKGEVFKYDNKYYQATKSVIKGTDLSDMKLPVDFNRGLVQVGENLPQQSQAAALTWPNGKDLAAGEIFYFLGAGSTSNVDGAFFMATTNVPAGSSDPSNSNSNFIRVGAYVDDSVQTVESLSEEKTKTSVDQQTGQPVTTTQMELSLEDGKVYYHQGTATHFLVKAQPETIAGSQEFISAFNPADAQWENNFHIFKPNPDSGLTVPAIERRSAPVGWNVSGGALVEINVGVAEAVIQDGEIQSLNIVNQGSGFPSTDALFVKSKNADGTFSTDPGAEIKVESGSIHGYQQSRLVDIENFRTSLNGFVSKFVEQVNGIYNPEDAPSEYLFGFKANLTRPTLGSNTYMEDLGLYGAEGNGELRLFRNESNMILPFGESDTFSLTSISPVVPDDLPVTHPDPTKFGLADFKLQNYYVRGNDGIGDDSGDPFDDDLEIAQNQDKIFQFYAGARRMQNVTTELDSDYPGDDGIPGSGDNEGRSRLLAYDSIPFRINAGSKAFLFGDNFSFDAVLENSWNLASSLVVHDDLTAETIKSSNDFDEASNEIALKVAELGNGEFTDMISNMNADLGNTLSDVNDNISHQETIETLLLDQRRAVSSVSIDEEVADLMQFQRSFQASSRVLNTLDKMLELVVMGLIK
jgi:flagellar hook-associated protein FlgK